MTDSQTESNSIEKNITAVVLDQKYFLLRLIYKGRSHNLYQALNKDDPNTYYLVEMKSQEQYNSFICDERILKKLNENCLIPKTIKTGVYKFKNNEYHYIVKEQCGPSLKLCFQHQNKKFTDSVFATIAISALNLLEKMHSASIIHCYLKPKKFITLQRGIKLLITDLKFAQKYKLQATQNQKTKSSYTLAINKYSSLNLHLGIRPSPKDDLESLAYILINFYIGGKLFKTKQRKNKNDKIKEIELQKMNLILEKSYPNLPKEITQFFYHVKYSSIDSYKNINYDDLRNYFYKMLQRNNVVSELKCYPWNMEIVNYSDHNSESSLSSVVEGDEIESDNDHDQPTDEQSIITVIENLNLITKSTKLLQQLSN